MKFVYTSGSSLLLVVALAATGGCASIAEKVADHLVEKDVEAIDHEYKVFHADLALFRTCLKERGGSCKGSDITALPGTTHAAASRQVVPAPPGSSETLASAVSGGYPAQSCHAVLGHPVVQQAAALHHHLRGHDVGAVKGVSVEKGQGTHGGPESTVQMTMSVDQVGHLHKGLMSSLGTTCWESLHDKCAELLAQPGGAADRPKLEADCRRVAFVRAYLEAYARSGRFLTVDIQASALVGEMKKDAARVTGEIYALLTDLQTDLAADGTTTAQSPSLSACAPAAGGSVQSAVSGKKLAEIGADAQAVAAELDGLIDKVEETVETRLGRDAWAVVSEVRYLRGEVASKSETLAQAVDQEADREVTALVRELDTTLGKVCTSLDQLVTDVSNDFTKVDTALRNKVFRVSDTGFVSRDATFGAKLPSLELTFDPTTRHLLQLTAYQGVPPEPGDPQAGTGGATGETLTSRSDFGDLGVATDTSGVGTGSSIGAEIVRVFLEAIFDAHDGLPAVTSATGLTLDKDYRLPSFTGDLGNVSLADFNRMTTINDRVAGSTRAITSKVIAGIGPFSLNNQPLEDFLVEIIATSVRQATSKATWCWYACNLNVDLETLQSDVKTAVHDKVKEVEGKVKAEGPKVEQSVKASAEAVGEHVKLRLKVIQ